MFCLDNKAALCVCMCVCVCVCILPMCIVVSDVKNQTCEKYNISVINVMICIHIPGYICIYRNSYICVKLNKLIFIWDIIGKQLQTRTLCKTRRHHAAARDAEISWVPLSDQGVLSVLNAGQRSSSCPPFWTTWQDNNRNLYNMYNMAVYIATSCLIFD